MGNSTEQDDGRSATKPLRPGARVGIIGGGQLGQMMGQAAVSMGFEVLVLDPTADCPASKVSIKQIVAEYDDQDALNSLADQVDVLTYEFENVSSLALHEASHRTWVPQGTNALEVCQDRLTEKSFLESCGLPIAPYESVPSADALFPALDRIGFPCVLKTTYGGYDGKGQVVIHGNDDGVALQDAAELASQSECVLEKWVDFSVEISTIVGANQSGDVICFPVSQNIHRDNILYQSIVPATVSQQVLNQAELLARRIAQKIDLVGVMGVEMFVTSGGQIYVNELAPRPHNSGHYTIEACDFSQFEMHIRAICGWPLPDPQLLSSVVMTNVLGQDLDGAYSDISAHPQWHFHFYGKTEARNGRKMGHITKLTGSSDQTAR